MNVAADTAEERAARICKVQELENAILSVPGLEGQPHANVLTALLSLYIRMACSHPCCTEACAIQATKAAFILSQKAASTAPHGAPIH